MLFPKSLELIICIQWKLGRYILRKLHIFLHN